MSPLRTLTEALRGAAVDLGRRPLLSLLSVAAMTVALLTLAGFALLSRGAREIFAHVAREAVVEVYIAPGADSGAVEDLAARLGADPRVRTVERIAPERALAEFTRLYPDLRDVQELLGDNPLPASLRVTPRTADPAEVAVLAAVARTHPATLSVRYDRAWLDALAQAGSLAGRAAALGAVVLLACALVTVGAVVRLGLDDRLDEVRLLRIAGAPVSFVLAPLLAAGSLLGAAGGALALLLVNVGRGALLGAAADTPFQGLAAVAAGAIPPLWSAVLVVGAAGAGALSAGLAAGRAALR